MVLSRVNHKKDWFNFSSFSAKKMHENSEVEKIGLHINNTHKYCEDIWDTEYNCCGIGLPNRYKMSHLHKIKMESYTYLLLVD